MCGIFGYITRDGQGPDIDRLRRIALVTQTRGDHAFGLAWIDRNGRMQTFKAPGSAKSHLDELERCRDAVAIIGHCRYATHGSPRDNRNNHPHIAGSGMLVHNGIIFNFDQIAQRHGLKPQTQCDSEILGLLIPRGGGSIVQRAAWAVNQTFGDLAVLGLWQKPTRMLLVRRGRPLCFGEGREGLYLASLPEGLPGEVKAFPDHAATVMRHQDGATSLDGTIIRLPTDDELSDYMLGDDQRRKGQ